jgi:hypothetical protein
VNEFYRNKVSLPRDVRQAESLRSALLLWKEKRLLTVVLACTDTNNLFRENFGALHQEYADAVDAILMSPSCERELSQSLLADIKTRFKTGCLAAVPGWIKDASGLCGSELEYILVNNPSPDPE